MIDISRKTYEKNGVQTIVDNDRILWLNEKHLEPLDHEKLPENILKCLSDYKKHRYKLVDEPINNPT